MKRFSSSDDADLAWELGNILCIQSTRFRSPDTDHPGPPQVYLDEKRSFELTPDKLHSLALAGITVASYDDAQVPGDQHPTFIFIQTDPPVTHAYEEALREFHKKFKFPVDLDINAAPDIRQDVCKEELTLADIGQQLQRMGRQQREEAASLGAEYGDYRRYRVSLLIEELGELASALATKSKLGIADALGDLLYIVVGTAITFGLPLSRIFWEIHRSNMTKKRPTKNNRSMRDKGSRYSPPRLAFILQGGKK